MTKYIIFIYIYIYIHGFDQYCFVHWRSFFFELDWISVQLNRGNMSSAIFQDTYNRDPFYDSQQKVEDDFSSTMRWAVVGSVGKLNILPFLLQSPNLFSMILLFFHCKLKFIHMLMNSKKYSNSLFPSESLMYVLIDSPFFLSFFMCTHYNFFDLLRKWLDWILQCSRS